MIDRPSEEEIKNMMNSNLKERNDFEAKLIAEMLADPENDVRDMNKPTFEALLAKREIMEEVATKLMGLHERENNIFNKKNPTLLPRKVNINEIKKALQGPLRLDEFQAFKECTMTIDQVKRSQIYKKTGLEYQSVDDMRDKIDPKFLIKARFADPVFRYYRAQAKSLGYDENNDYNGFMI